MEGVDETTELWRPKNKTIIRPNKQQNLYETNTQFVSEAYLLYGRDLQLLIPCYEQVFGELYTSVTH